MTDHALPAVQGPIGTTLTAVFLVLVSLVGLHFANGSAKADFIGHGAPVRDVVLSADGRYAATAGFDDLAILWDVATRKQLVRFYGHEAGVNAAAFLPPLPGAQHPRVVTVSDDGSIRIWDGDTGLNLAVLTGHSKKVVAVATSQDGRKIVTGSWDRSVRIWDAHSATQSHVFQGHRNSVNAVQILPDGSAVISAGYDGDIWIWPLDGSSEPYRFAKVGFPINALALSGDGKMLVTGSADQSVRIWDLETRKKRQDLSSFHDGAVLAVSVSQDGRQFASGGVGGSLLIWDSGSDEPRITMQVEHYRAVWSLRFSPKGDRI